MLKNKRLRKSKYTKTTAFITLSLTFMISIGFSTLRETLNISGGAKFDAPPTLKATTSDDTDAFRNPTYKSYISTITFENEINIPDDVIDSWDISEAQNGDIIAYVTEHEETDSYNLYIQANSEIYANKDMSWWFAELEQVESINGLDLVNTSNTTNMRYMFYRTGIVANNFALDLGNNFYTSKVIDMSGMFDETGADCTNFTLNLGEHFDTSNVTNMAYMFSNTGDGSKKFTLDLGDKFDTSNDTYMPGMFSGCGSDSDYFALDLGDKFDTSKVYSMSGMFSGIGRNNPAFELDLGDKFDTSNVVDMRDMFGWAGYGNPGFSINLGDKFNTSQVNDMYKMFAYTGYAGGTINCTITISNPNMSEISYMYMFESAAMWDNSKITVNYTSETSELVDLMIATKSNVSNVVKGYNISNIISFTISGVTYNAYKGMTWREWIASEYNNGEYEFYEEDGYVAYFPGPQIVLKSSPPVELDEEIISGYNYSSRLYM